MTIHIENEWAIATFAEQGAELVSLQSKESQIEYIWQGDAQFWGWHAPVLFPFVGRLKEDCYQYNGRTYTMGQHGFARDCLFEPIEIKQTSVSFLLTSNEETKKKYPFDFRLILSYRLEKTQLTVTYQVQNIGGKTMYFSIGGHPAFNIPLESNLAFNDYYLKFTPQKSRIQIPLVGPFADFKQKTLAQTNTTIALRRELFNNDALIFETKGMSKISIESEKSAHSIHVSYENIPYVGIWTLSEQEAPFVCIEPWWGIADGVETTGDLVDKVGINRLEVEQIFETAYTITIK